VAERPKSDAGSRRILAAVLAEEARAAAGGHPGPDELLDYHAGRLAPDAEERLRDHLVACRACARKLLELEPLAEPDPGDEDAVADFALNASVRKLEARIRDEPGGLAPAAASDVRGPGVPKRPSPLPLRALAAVLAVAVVGLTAWAVVLRGATADLRRTLADLERPRPNVAVTYLEPVDSRGTPPAAAELAPGQPFWVLVLIPEDPRSRPEYEVTLLGPAGEELYRERGFEMNDGGGISLSLPRRMGETPGEYRLLLHAVDGGERTLAGEYLLRSPSE
jgi:hypothetical protein